MAAIWERRRAEGPCPRAPAPRGLGRRERSGCDDGRWGGLHWPMGSACQGPPRGYPGASPSHTAPWQRCQGHRFTRPSSPFSVTMARLFFGHSCSLQVPSSIPLPPGMLGPFPPASRGFLPSVLSYFCKDALASAFAVRSQGTGSQQLLGRIGQLWGMPHISPPLLAVPGAV